MQGQRMETRSRRRRRLPRTLAQARKKLLANLRRSQNQPSAEGSEFDIYWGLLREALRDIHNKNCSRLSFEELYRAAYKIVLTKKGDALYQKVTDFESEWFAENVIPRIQKLVTRNLVTIDADHGSRTSANERRQTGEKFLRGVRDTWDDHNVSMNMTTDILMYLDRGFLQAENGKASIFVTTIALFRDHILQSRLEPSSDKMVIKIITDVMLDQIDMERHGDVIDRALIRSCSRMLSCLYRDQQESESEKLYLIHFEADFLRKSREFYAEECQRLLRESDASAWLRHTERRLNEETDRCGTTIELETLPKVSQVIEEELIKKHLDDFLNLEASGLRAMVDNDKVDDLSILYSLIARVDSNKTALQNILSKRVVELGMEIEVVLRNTDFSINQAEGEEGAAESEKTKALNPAAQQTAAAIKWVDDVLMLKDKFDHLWTACFAQDKLIETALTKSVTEFINVFSRSSEYVSLFIDDSLKRGIRGKTEAEVDAVLEKAIILIRYLQDRDLFQTYYQRHLARRLLHGKSESHDVEKQIILRMKQELGQQFTSKFEGMFRDLATSVDLTKKYRDHVVMAGDGTKKIDLHINVLTTNCWPPEVMGRTAQIGEGSRVTCTYPREVERLQASFEQHYLSERNGRKLTWIGTTGSADIKCTFPAIPGKPGVLSKERRYEINVPTFGMVVMLLFNDLPEGKSLTFAEIQEKTNISTPDLARTLTAIAVAPKSRVLLKEPPTKSVKPTDTFSFNAAFQSKTIKIKAPIINAVSKVEDTQERKLTEDKTTQERSHVIDAAIVRIMK
jgi:cullin 3